MSSGSVYFTQNELDLLSVLIIEEAQTPQGIKIRPNLRRMKDKIDAQRRK